jgi:hypothetical protein
MKNILLILILFLSACKSVENTDVSITNKIENVISDTTKQLNDSVVVNLDTVFVNEIQVIREDIDHKDDKKAIEQHEKKTNLKVIDKTSNKVDTNKGWIAYSVVENMKVAKSYSVKIRISKLKQNKAVLILGDNTIKVKSNVPVVFESFFEKYWQWVMTTIIIPIFIYFWNRKKKRKTKKS